MLEVHVTVVLPDEVPMVECDTSQVMSYVPASHVNNHVGWFQWLMVNVSVGDWGLQSPSLIFCFTRAKIDPDLLSVLSVGDVAFYAVAVTDGGESAGTVTVVPLDPEFQV